MRRDQDQTARNPYTRVFVGTSNQSFACATCERGTSRYERSKKSARTWQALCLAYRDHLFLRRIPSFRIEVQLEEGSLCLRRVVFSIARELGQSRRHNRLSIHFKVPAQMLTVVAASESIRSQRHQPRQQPRSKLIRH